MESPTSVMIDHSEFNTLKMENVKCNLDAQLNQQMNESKANNGIKSNILINLTSKLLNTASILLYILILTSKSCTILHKKYIHPILEYSEQYYSYSEDLTHWKNRDSITYIERECGYADNTGFNQEDITWNVDNQAKHEDFADLVMLHGAGIIPNLLSNTTTSKLRDLILNMNQNEPKYKQFDLKEKSHRWSLRVNPYDYKQDMDGVIRQALLEIASNAVLYDSLEDLLGPNSAITELAAITSEPGAPEQDWHNDVWYDGSATNYARKYTSQYSLFIYLQDTFKDMGSTGFCLGTHMCTDVQNDAECFQVEPEAGSGVLLNSCTLHQGAGNSAYHRKDGTRVMFIVTFATKPNPMTDPRILPLGSVYGIPWYAWGHTINEFFTLNTRKWNVLHALGVKAGQDYGWSYLLGAIAAHGENGSNGLHAEEWFLEEGTWEYFWEWCVDIATYFIPFYFIWTCFTRNFQHLLKYYAIITVVFASLHHLISQSHFAKGISTKTRFYDMDFPKLNYSITSSQSYVQSITIPKTNDILFGDRLDAYYLYKNAYYYDYHPGNQLLNNMVKRLDYDVTLIPKGLRSTYIHQIIASLPNSRFLQMNSYGHWTFIQNIDSILWHQIIFRQYPILKLLSKEMDFIIAHCKYGNGARPKSVFVARGLKDSILVQKWTRDLVLDLRGRLFDSFGIGYSSVKDTRNEQWMVRSIIQPYQNRLNDIPIAEDSDDEDDDIEEEFYGTQAIQNQLSKFGVQQYYNSNDTHTYQTVLEMIQYMQDVYDDKDEVVHKIHNRKRLKDYMKRKEKCRNFHHDCLIWSMDGWCDGDEEMVELCAPACHACF